MKRIFLIVLFTVAACYVSACVFLFFKQRSSLYFPKPEWTVSDPAISSLKTDGETLRIWTRTTDSQEAVIYFGGNSEDVSSNFRTFSTLLPKQNLYFVNYRGFGGSTGSPSETALFSDAIAVYDWVHEKYPNISVVGRSLGSGVAVYLASARKPDKLVLITPYDSIENVAKKSFPIFPISLLLGDKFNSVSRVQGITAKTLIILAENDEVIPRENSDALISAFPSDQVATKVIQGTNHNTIGLSPAYFELIGGFYESAYKKFQPTVVSN